MTNFLLLLILFTLLFGAGAVLGFFSTLFWIVVVVLAVIFVLIVTMSSMNRASKVKLLEKDENGKGYKLDPTATVFILGIPIVIVIWLLLSSSHPTPTTVNYPQTANTQYVATPSGSTKGIQYPSVNRTAFLTNCSKKSSAKLCTCVLTYLEKNYSIDEFLQMEAAYVANQKYPEGFVAAALSCSNTK